MKTAPPTGLRTWQTRVMQTTAYEAGSIVLIAPIVATVFDHGLGESTVFLVALSVLFLVWDYTFNLAFDRIEFALGMGPASNRDHRFRVLHAVGLEVSSIFVSLPIIIWVTGLGFWEAVAVDLAFSAIYAVYAYLFHLAFDRLYPVSATGSHPAEKAFI